MLFNSFDFILLFLPMCLLGYFGLNHYKRYQSAKAFLLGMSLWFYGYFHVSYLLLLLGSIVVNYLLYRKIRNKRYSEQNKGNAGAQEEQRSTKRVHSAAWRYTALGVVLNLLVLGFFKYTDFFLENVNALFGMHVPMLGILLPLGISFFTFQQVGFLVDVYRGKTGDYAFLDYAVFVSFFPQLIAGPIVTHDELIPQLANVEKKKLNAEHFSAGCVCFIVGLAKKILIADVMGRAVGYGYGNLEALNTAGALIVMLAFYVQIYFDFSGYSDMAIGLGKMFNLELPVNFESPYKARTVREHWKGWHMTLTRFFTEYVYIPLGGSWRGSFYTYRNTLIVFLLSGIWHGAGWGFVVWGLLNGLGIVLCRVCEKPIAVICRRKIGSALLWFANMLFISISWVFFKSENLHTAAAFFKRLFTGGGGMPQAGLLQNFRQEEFWYVLKVLRIDQSGYGDLLLCIAYFLVAFVLLLVFPNVRKYMQNWKPRVGMAIILAILFIWSFVSLSGVSTFLYYNF